MIKTTTCTNGRSHLSLIGTLTVLVLSLSPAGAGADSLSSSVKLPYSFGPFKPTFLAVERGVTERLERGILKTPIVNDIITQSSIKKMAIWNLEVAIEEGGTSGPHCHPGPALMCIERGEAVHWELQENGNLEPATVMNAPNCFIESPHEVGDLRNTGAGELRVHFTFIVPADPTVTADLFWKEFFVPVADLNDLPDVCR